MKILIVGANGFLGSMLCDLFSGDLKNEIYAFDRYSRNSVFKSQQNLTKLVGEVAQIERYSNELENIDVMLHCFSTTRPGIDSGRDSEIEEHEIIPSIKLFDFCSKMGVKKVIYLSSGGAVYGNTQLIHNSEELKPQPISAYGVAKLAIENSLINMAKEKGFKPLVLRISNPYGPQQRPFSQGLINTALQNVFNGNPQWIFGDGSMVRDYIYADDLLEMISTLVFNDPMHNVYNLGSGVGTSVNEVLSEIKQAITHEILTTTCETPANLIHYSVLNIERYTHEFDKPTFVTVKDGIRHMIETYKFS